MRTTIELPDELLKRAKSKAALDGISLKDFFISAVEEKLTPTPEKRRLDIPVICTGSPVIRDLTPEQIEDAAFGPVDDYLLFFARRR